MKECWFLDSFLSSASKEKAFRYFLFNFAQIAQHSDMIIVSCVQKLIVKCCQDVIKVL